MRRNHWITEDNRFNRQAAARSCWSLVRAVILIETSFVLLYPLLYAVSVAFRPPAQLNDPVVIWIPKSLTLDNIRQVWDFIEFPKLLGNTVLIDLFSTLFQTLSCCVVGYGFARFAFKGKGLLFAVVILTIVIPPQAVTISNFMQFKQMGILDTPLAFYLPALTANGIRSGLFIFIFRQFFRGMPVEIEDAAYVDGCGPVRTFLRIMLPNALSPVLIVFLFSLVWYWNDTFFSGMYLDQFKTLSVTLEVLKNNLGVMLPGLQADQFTISAYLQAGVLLIVAPVLLIYILLQKYFTESITRTGLIG